MISLLSFHHSPLLPSAFHLSSSLHLAEGFSHPPPTPFYLPPPPLHPLICAGSPPRPVLWRSFTSAALPLYPVSPLLSLSFAVKRLRAGLKELVCHLAVQRGRGGRRGGVRGGGAFCGSCICMAGGGEATVRSASP